jgi:regulator of protease activity HflC (stomatin/prohibitin superfamily)
MVIFIFGIIALIAGISACVYIGRTCGRKYRWIPLSLGFAVSLVLVVVSCVASVPTGHTGVVTVFGKVESKTFEAGINLKAPWETIVAMDNRVQKSTTVLPCFSSDIQEVTIYYTLNYQIDKENAQEIYKRIGVSYYDTVILPNIAESVKVVAARYTAEQLVGSRTELASEVDIVLSEGLSRYNIQVVSTAIEDMDFTDAFTNAVEAKQVAAQNKLQAEIEQAQKVMEQEAAAQMAIIQAEANAETERIKAEAELEVVKIKADGVEYAGQKEAAANEAIAESLTEELLRYYYIQNWNGKLPDTYVGSEDVSTIIVGANKDSTEEDEEE